LKTDSPKGKKELRNEALRTRDALTTRPEEKKAKDQLIKENFLSLPEYKSAHKVLFFASFRSEVDTFPLIRKSLEDGKKVFLPKVDREKKKLDIYEVKSLSDLKKGYLGIPEPPAGTPENPRHCDIIIFPGAAFDPEGGRLGYGGGYYDKLLSGESKGKRPRYIALAYEEQVMSAPLPLEKHDMKVDAIVTDKRVIRVNGSRSK
jgi:5-formyltetrahydrofolate cyclo-ligase